MAACVFIDEFGVLQNSPETSEECSTYLLLEPFEYHELSDIALNFKPLTHEEFLIMLPALIGALLGFKLFKITLKQYFNW